MGRSEWQWFGTAGHFICASRCNFRMHTHVGKFCVSTVGDFRQERDDVEPTKIGHDRLYETMVFDTSRYGDGSDDGRWSEVASAAYMTDEQAQRGHLEMCERFDRETGR
jgi:hypothetical protein